MQERGPAANPVSRTAATTTHGMAFAFGKLAFILLRPSNLLLLVALAGLAGSWRRPRAWARVALALALGAALLATLLPVGNWLIAPLEDRFPPPAAGPGRVDGVVVLGGGVLPRITAARGTPAFFDTGERYMALLELARRHPDARVLFTGGVGRLGGGVPSEADGVRLLLERHGLAGRVLLEGEARTTRENALRAKAMLDPRPGETWLLVTSAGHMPRSVGVFRAAGWDGLVPWPVDYRTTGPFELFWKPQVAERLYELDEAAYEWAGLAYYRLLGWTRELFPGPA
jgi:uncharacterized SAM-binding protein YcdF (DUF218 family)